VERWGPARELAEILKESPPLLGNRRQGPDLANVGNRRTAEWNRIHLEAPRSTSPGSRMPNYAHLFTPNNPRGGALLAYLESLGGDTSMERAELVARWQPDSAVLAAGDTARGRELFAYLCTNCHGPAGRGDGTLAARLTLTPPNWPEQGWRHVVAGAPAKVVTRELARLIKFGSPATPMAGHETLTDHELASLVAYVRTLGKDPH
jgi:cytochrome c oxidase cbb3-type subunit 2